MKYKGIELKEINEPQIFDPPKKMCVWSEEFKEPKIESIAAIFPQSSLLPRRVASVNKDFYMSLFQHCAEIPKEPKPRKATNRELAKWIASGNGEVKDIIDVTMTFCTYPNGLENIEVRDGIKVRKWEDAEWHDPTAEYMGLEENENG